MTLSRTARLVATAFTVNGVLHLVRPQVFEPAVPQTRKVAALASVGLLVGVYPANVQMAVDAMAGDKPTWKALTLARLPLQWPMIRAMWRTARG